MDSGLSADITPTGRPPKCFRCHREFPVGTVLQFISCNDPARAGKFACDNCIEYYGNKDNTVKRNDAPGGYNGIGNGYTGPVPMYPPPTPDANVELVRKDIAKGQRGESSRLPVAALGSFGPTVLLPNSGNPRPYPPSFPQPFPSSFPQSFSASYGQNPLAAPSPAVGYTNNHDSYMAERSKRASLAYSAHQAYVVPIQVVLCHLPPAALKAKNILMEIASNVPLHVGAVELKKICFDTIRPLWDKNSRGFQIGLGNVTLREDDWALITERDPDRDVIAMRFMKAPTGKAASTANTALQFRPKQIKLRLQLENEVYTAWQNYMDSADEFNSQPVYSAVKAQLPQPKPLKRKKKDTQPQDTFSVSPAPTTISMAGSSSITTGLSGLSGLGIGSFSSQRAPPDSPSTPPAKRLHLAPESPGSPVVVRGALQEMLGKQKLAGKREVGNLLKKRSIRVLLHPVKAFDTISSLIGTTTWESFCGPAFGAELVVDFDEKNAKKGAFKQAMLGESTSPLFNDRTNYDICVKQAFYHERTGSAGVSLMQTVIHDAPFQAKLLVMEMRLLAFGTAALSGCYKWIQRFIRKNTEPPFEIPQMRFIQAALGLSEDGTKVFLIEERIRPDIHGPFRKFMNNRNVIPVTLPDPADAVLGRFLAFTQHLQYWMTLKLFFISDYQGGRGLLTDPQVLSSSELGDIFAEGNVSSGYDSFESDHVCNEFCKFFELRTDYDNWPVDSNSRLSKLESSEPDALFYTGGSVDMDMSISTIST